MEAAIEKECSALGGLFQTVIGDMKSSYPVWEDFITKAGKLQSQLRATAVTVATFLDAFQKVADLATNSRVSAQTLPGHLHFLSSTGLDPIPCCRLLLNHPFILIRSPGTQCGNHSDH
ncbi:Metastasis suppressor protein 1 [Takifugu flavidus]|uniref:Metastasis suppressor protein 1 n=1 Tax=Takifugu flavidus TaxID=433684 RepID=A0A5C6PJ87_9TELE|nr:Metastasis suppressor protein 1 [Takifugu flavidus]